jgi:hypothetical protein
LELNRECALQPIIKTLFDRSDEFHQRSSEEWACGGFAEILAIAPHPAQEDPEL